MSQKRLNLTYALKEGVITHISEVERGLKCGCICPACKDKLIARKGKRVMHHFAHQSIENCEYGYESSLHLAAKDILLQTKKMVIPPVYICFTESYKEEICISEAKEIAFDRVELEHRFNDIVPDIVVYVGKKQFFIEIFVTHCIDEEKLKKLKAADISTIEIDLSKTDSTISTDELTSLLMENDKTKYWKYNSLANKCLNKFYSVADKRDVIARGFALHVDWCPIAVRIWRGKPYANFIDDCASCEFCIAHSFDEDENQFILCTGRQCISSIEDFNIPFNARREVHIQEKQIAELDQWKTLLLRGECPNCGGRLLVKNGKYGNFLGCNQYPRCKFTAPANLLYL